MYYYDPTYILLIPALILTFWAQAKVKGAYNKYSRERNSTGLTGADAARKMLEANGLRHVPINILKGDALTNYYNPKDQTLNLSQQVYSQPSIAAISIACHEVGHACQDAENYSMLALRNTIVPIVNFTSYISWPLIIIGIMFTGSNNYGRLIFDIGILCFVVVILFHLVTLPVEFNASNRALAGMEELGIVNQDDYKGSKKVLSAAAMTYVAALAVAVANLLRIFIISRNRN
ncbi:MAG: zinc metallopeptidase [Mogibacterium sp.]|nr:zinc metallopeptidase [Mogibacterium sp.]